MLTGASILYLRDVVIYITPHVYDSYYERFIIFFLFCIVCWTRAFIYGLRCADKLTTRSKIYTGISAVLTN